MDLSDYERWYRDGGIEKYSDGFARSGEKSIQVEKLQDRLRGRIPTGNHSEVSLLDIGCGTGQFTISLCRALFAKPEAVTITADLVDLADDAFSRFRTLASEVILPKISIRTTSKRRWSEVTPQELPGPYDLIVADHVFYGEDLTTDLVYGLVDRLNKGGVAMVSLQSIRSHVDQMRRAAGMRINTAEDFADVVSKTDVLCEEVIYSSSLEIRGDNQGQIEWLFATARADDQIQEELLDRFCQVNGKGAKYLNNIGKMFLLRGG